MTCYKYSKIVCLLFFATVVTIPVFMSSCKSGSYKYELMQIDTLIDINNHTASLLNQIDTVGVINSRKLYADNWKEITNVLVNIEDAGLVRESEYWDYITLYESKERQLKKLLRRFISMAGRHKVNEIQLKAFRNSVRKDQIPADSVKYYLEVESVAVYDVNREAETFVPEIIVTKQVLDSLHAFSDDALKYFRDISEGETKKNKNR